jgi:hypothetical protein
MKHDGYWCIDCDEEIVTWSDFMRHAHAGHACMAGRPE